MRRMMTLVTATLFAVGMFAAPALAHPHSLDNPGTCLDIPQEPDHLHGQDPTDGAIHANKHYNQGDQAHGGALHPIHHFLHWGPGAASQNSEITPHDNDPVNVTAWACDT